ncbi:hypothetical protein N665_0045s0013 [Sinapis alba]|nr:hypothetical protein N665_0045s0013 [Sinapis alba]
MSNVRPWFRLSSIARPTSQGSSDPTPPPRQTPTSLPTNQPSPPSPPRQPSSPPRQQTPPPPPPQEQSPYHSPSSRHTSPPTPTKAKFSSPSPSPPPPQERSPYHSPSSRHMSQLTPTKAKSPLLTPSPPPPKEQSPYHSPSSHHTSPPTPIKAKSPLLTPPRSSYTPPPSPKEVQEALPPRKPTSPTSPAHSTTKYESESFKKIPSPRVLSPYSLPPSQLHSERETTQKNILTAEKTNQLHEPNHHNHQGNNNTKKTHHQPSFWGTRVITIAGENKGAVMEIIQSPSSSNKTRGEGTHSSRGFNGAGEKGRRLQSSSSSSDEGEGKKETTKNHNNNGNNMNLPMKAFMNSNVQMINNSIVYNSMASHHDPGIHLKLYRKPGSGNGSHVKDYGNNGGGYTK